MGPIIQPQAVSLAFQDFEFLIINPVYFNTDYWIVFFLEKVIKRIFPKFNPFCTQVDLSLK